MTRSQQSLESWSLEDANELYGVKHWGADYFQIGSDGSVHVCPKGCGEGPTIALTEVVQGLRERGLGMPVLLRFGDILASQIRHLHHCFGEAIHKAGYRGTYRGVYPIKVNQQQHVLEEVTTFGAEHGHGLEAGSKPELMAALTYMHADGGLLICNGYKDVEFIDLALYATRLGIHSVIVVETPGEVPLIIQRSRELGIRPHIGIRVKLSSRAGGHWQESGGDRSVFGLNTAQVVRVTDQLREAGLLDCLEMLHYHLGSQIPDIRHIRTSVIEAARVYAGLVREGAPMGMLDLGGGLAVDYDGSHTNYASSRNYTLQEYCADIVETVQAVAEEVGVEHPTLITESGRATVAYHSVLLFDILDASPLGHHSSTEPLPENAHDHVVEMRRLASEPVTPRNCQEVYHNAIYYRDEVRQLFKHGHLSLRERALAEQDFWSALRCVAGSLHQLKYVPDEFEGLERLLADIYYGNFSVFQSLPDAWAIDQLFPIMPIHRLNEQPTRECILSDITCDCDGKIDRFTDLKDIKRTLALHSLKEGEDYVLGAFLVGAYQETLGDLHNLLGDTNVVSIRLTSDGFEFEREIEGDTVADVLSYVEYEPKDMAARFRRKAEQAVRQGRISAQQRRTIVEAFDTGLRGYTYFER